MIDETALPHHRLTIHVPKHSKLLSIVSVLFGNITVQIVMYPLVLRDYQIDFLTLAEESAKMSI